MNIREVKESDLESLLELYTQLHDNDMPLFDINLKNLWNEILEDKNHHLIAGFINNKLVCSCVLIVVRNLTRNQRSYALIENVITHEQYRNRGYASQILNFAKDIAQKENCYKIMLMTGSKQEQTLHFYEKAGYNKNDKTAFIQWL